MHTLQLRIPWSGFGGTLLLSALVFAPYGFWKPGQPGLALLAAIPAMVVYATLILRLRVAGTEGPRRVLAIATSRLRLGTPPAA